MSSSAKIQSSSRLKKVRLLSLFNPLFLATTGIFSLFAFAIWQYWLNPDLTSTSVQTPETSQENQQNVTKNNKENIAESNQEANNKINALESITNNANNNSQVPKPPTPEQQLGSLLSQTNPTNDIFKSLTTQNNRNQNTTGGAKLYEQLRNLPNLFPDLLPPQTGNNGIINSSVVGNTNIPTNQLTQYELRSNTQRASTATTTPLSQAVNNVMSNRNAANTNTQTSQQTPYNNINTNVPPNTTVAPNSNYGNYGNNNAYGNYGNNNAYGNYGNYGNNNGYGNSYGGNVNGVGANPYNSGQLPVQGYNNNRITQTGFPTSRF
jgi:hypothetical protein